MTHPKAPNSSHKHSAKPDVSESLWGGGYAEAMHSSLAQLSVSLGDDMVIADADLRGSAAYARALGRAKVLTSADAERLAQSLETIRQEFQAGSWQPQGHEDVHSAIEAEVTKRLGELGERLHTGRSRNDQVSTAFRLTLSEHIDALVGQLVRLQTTLIGRAETSIDVLMPAYTHLQRAQPVRLSHWLMSYVGPLQRDTQRFLQIRSRVLSMPLGSGAVSGHPFDLDRQALADELGFESLTQNSLDAVGDRDFAVEFCFAAALSAVHLSRLAEELVTFSTTEFGYVLWPDALSTGSSLMPNKKNPDLAELVRGRSAGAIGDAMSMLVLLKGLAGSYQRDLQHDKPPVWRTSRALAESLEAMHHAMAQIRFDSARMFAALSDDVLATEAADLLVARGLPFRQAHRLVAAVVADGRSRQLGIKGLANCEGYEPPAPLTLNDLRQLDVLTAIERRQTPGGTSLAAVQLQIQQAKAALSQNSAHKEQRA